MSVRDYPEATVRLLVERAIASAAANGHSGPEVERVATIAVYAVLANLPSPSPQAEVEP